MKSIAIVLSAGMLFCWSFTACVQEPRPAVAHVQSPQRGVTMMQAESAPPRTDSDVEPARPDVNVAPPAGAQPESGDVRTQASQAVALASRQVDRLRRMEVASTDLRRQDIESTLSDLESKRGRVLQDLRELELQPASQAVNVHLLLQEDVANLLDAVRTSYFVAPGPSQGLPRPSPLPPSSIY